MKNLFGEEIHKTAVISADGLYRYKLSRTWDYEGPRAVWVLLNPSTADATKEDATTRRLLGFSRQFGMGGYDLVNLFAFRATRPVDMEAAADPIGPENDERILATVADARVKRVIVAWGALGNYRNRDLAVLKMLRKLGATAEALHVTQDGMPGHPLYLPGDASPQPYVAPSWRRS